jgi:hypothetical protein
MKNYTLPEKDIDKLLDNCTPDEILTFIESLEIVIPRMINWYSKHKSHRKSIKLVIEKKADLVMTYEIIPNYETLP